MTDADLAQRLSIVRQRIAAAGGGRRVRIVAVTKGFGPECIEAAMAVGCRDIGENYAQELLGKLADVRGPRPRVHFIGRLQTNKVRLVSTVVDVWQSVDRPELVDALARHGRPGATVLIQVNVADQPQQGGCPPGEAAALVEAARQAGLGVVGLMAIGRPGDPEAARPGFRTVRRLAEELGLAECSMGMTDDLEVAVEEGSTMVRVGTALFAPRPQRATPGN